MKGKKRDEENGAREENTLHLGLVATHNKGKRLPDNGKKKKLPWDKYWPSYSLQ